MNQTTFEVPGMDCAAEEQLVRMALAGVADVRGLNPDLATRRVIVQHQGSADGIEVALSALRLGARRLETRLASDQGNVETPAPAGEARTLVLVLCINAGMFVGESVGAFLADSSALLADSLDMFADAAVYALALAGVHRSRYAQLRAARLSGVLQLLLATGALAEVLRRLVFGSAPETPIMVTVALAALVANLISMWLLARHRHGGAHMKASWIFTTNDVLANIGVITAGFLVQLLDSNVPDLVVATAIALIVVSGAIRILRLRS